MTRANGGGAHRGQGRRAERGAAVVEAAIVTPVVIMMILIVVESGMLLFSNLTVSHAATDAARTAIIARNAEDADGQILARVKASTVGLKRAQLDRIVIYPAASPDADPPSACTTNQPAASIAGVCSVYTAASLDLPYQQLNCGWCPDARHQSDLIGVWIRMRYVSVTGLLNSVQITDQKILPIELDV